jgi:4-hydroxyphenylpyruvate dioxygenase
VFAADSSFTIDHVEFYVGDAQLSSYFYRTAFGLQPVLYTGPDEGTADRISYLLEGGTIRLVMTSGLQAEGPMCRHVAHHGDGVRDIAFGVADASRAYGEALARGAKSVTEPTIVEHGTSRILRASVTAWGNVIHSFVERRGGAGFPFAGRAVTPLTPTEPSYLRAVDHMAICLPAGMLDPTIAFYKEAFGFVQTHEVNIRTPHSSMNSRVLMSPNGKVKFALMEPGRPGDRGQVEEFLAFNHGSGVQHLAFATDDIIATARRLERFGINFLRAPQDYYETLSARVGALDVDLETLMALRILVARDEHGLLLQAFTLPIHSRPTFFTEVIQRRGATGFGPYNVKALFGAIEREQLRRRS